MRSLLIAVRLIDGDPAGGPIHTRTVDVPDERMAAILTAALGASEAGFELAYKALGREIGPYDRSRLEKGRI